MSVACLCVGSRIAHDGGVWTVLALTGERATIEDRAAGQTRSVRITHLLSSPGSRLLDPPSGPPVGAVGPLLSNLLEVELRAVCDRAAHVRDVLTGYRSGSPDDALAGEPGACFLPGSPRMDRYRAKASELGVSLATLRRWVAAYTHDGEAGLIDARHHRASEPSRGIDARWLDELGRVLDEHVGVSRPTQKLLLDRRRRARERAARARGCA